jgi:D-inositol-3-phosphate glycosyltransferase
LAGSSPPPESFWQRANKWGLADQIRYVARPSQEELIALYQNASIFALPSDEEGLGIVILEAMACAIPVVSTRSGGPDGIIKDDDDGFLTPLNDAEAMANRIETLLNDPQRNIAMGDKARITVESRYDEQVTGAVFLEVWDRLLSTSSSSREDSNGIIAFSKS